MTGLKQYKRLVVLGSGESGVGAAVLGKVKDYDVFVSDFGTIAQKYKDVLLKENILFEETKHTKEQILNADVVVKSPGIPDSTLLVVELKEKGITVISEIEFASWFTKAKLIGITGSNGKTTTTSLLYHILKNAGLNVGVGGNIGDSFALQVAKCDYDYYVLELSSFQLDGIESLKLDVSILLNITPDHLDRYEYSLDKYIDSKFQIIKNIDENTVFIYSNDDENIVNRLPRVTLPSSSYSFSINELGSEFARVKDSEILIDINNPLRISVDSTSLKGKHNSYNIMASVTAASVLGIQESQILTAVETFQPIEHRMERVVVLNDVEYINDSKATNVDSTFYALDSIEDNVIWIAGGVDKGNDYSQLIPLVISKVHGMICLGKDNQKLHATFGGFVKRIENAKNADEAVKKASAMAGKGFTVLLSPACASFDLFKNYEDRGLKFKQAITKLTK
ncbi:MAG: UDP-N-acetylmuramoylalanine--D-glutamate ligase [Flavobacteriales bacterium]|jgi:UDP-N-acetylmuramoylalanine--D-glutamate ligase|tara:strand:+ start:7489 stop:8844 length:1356 start_codon:yes stop_codon:yes gene_type:complete